MNGAKNKMLLETLRKEILGGKYASGQSYPSVRALERRFGIPRSTIGHALDELFHQGLISRKQGRGTFVTSMATSRKIGLVVPGVACTDFFQPIGSKEEWRVFHKEKRLPLHDLPETAVRKADNRREKTCFIRFSAWRRGCSRMVGGRGAVEVGFSTSFQSRHSGGLCLEDIL